MKSRLDEELSKHTVLTAEMAEEIALSLGLSSREVIGEAKRQGKLQGVQITQPVVHSPKLPANTAGPGKVVDYVVASAKTQSGLAQEVKSLITRGWEPLGGVSAAAFGASPLGGNQYIQAMVKRA